MPPGINSHKEHKSMSYSFPQTHYSPLFPIGGNYHFSRRTVCAKQILTEGARLLAFKAREWCTTQLTFLGEYSLDRLICRLGKERDAIDTQNGIALGIRSFVENGLSIVERRLNLGSQRN